MARTERAGRGLVEDVFGGRGGYHVRYPGAGEHAEVPLSKQVLVLAKGSKPFAIYPVSTGKPSTPTVTGHYHFYLRSPGYNSEGMYYSFYWHNGYAVHGYAEVPTYAASHGCVRTYIADQPRIYDQLRYGESIFVF
jgi:lipoprotein-anchoring transpeptidase ErfK/SrfK